MIYNPVKIKKLYESIENHLKEEEKKIIKEILSNYNKLFSFAKWKYDDIGRKEETYMKESKENELLRQKNEQLKEKLGHQIRINEILKKELEDK